MKTTFDINDILYKIINVASVTTTINGGVYRIKKPLNSELRDIVILPLSNYNGDEIINDATFMVNCFCKNFTNGTPDITNQMLLQDVDQKSMSYVNLRINCSIEK